MSPSNALNWSISVCGQALWGPVSQEAKQTMGQVVLNVNGLTFLEQIGKGANVITKSTDNPKVPGNAEKLAEFVTTQTALVAANAACEAARTDAKAKTAERQAALTAWMVKRKTP